MSYKKLLDHILEADDNLLSKLCYIYYAAYGQDLTDDPPEEHKEWIGDTWAAIESGTYRDEGQLG